MTASADVLLCGRMADETDTPETEPEERNLGTQPLDALMIERGLTNHDIVAVTKLPLTHKAVQRARRGRKLTKNTQRRVVEAFNAALKSREEDREFALTELFNYKA